MSTRPEPLELYTPAEVAQLFRVDPKTVTRWAKAGRLTSMRTVGGHRRYLRTEIDGLLTIEKLPYEPITKDKKR